MTSPDAQAAALLAWAAAEYAAGREAAAEGGARAALALAPANPAARHLLALCRVAAGALEEGARELQGVVAASPGNDEARLHLAEVVARLGRHAEVVALLEEVVRTRPDFAAAIRPLAAALWETGARTEAVASWRRLAALQPDDGNTQAALGHALRQIGERLEAGAVLRRAVTLLAGLALAGADVAQDLRDARASLAEALLDLAMENPPGDALVAEAVVEACMAQAGARSASILVRCGSILHRASEHRAAEACYEAALALEPERHEALMFGGMLKLLRGDLEAGWPAYEGRRILMDQLGPFRDPPVPPWRVPADLSGKTIRVVLEQGVGDCVQFMRYVPLLADRGARVELVAPQGSSLPPLIGEMPAVAGFMRRAASEPAADVVLPVMSLALAFGTTLDTIPALVPYLAAPADRREEWRARLAARNDDRPQVGVVWWGNPTFANDRQRSIPLARFAPLMERDDVSFHVLAPAVRDDERDQAASLATIHDGLRDYADTAALVEQLDLVISVDTSVAHLAGALGRKVWIMLPWEPDWRWLLGREDTPWYPTARLFRQPARGDWDGVLARMREALNATFG